MTDGTAAPISFDAVLLVDAAAAARVAGLRLVERAAFTLVRAGARRLLCVGAVPVGPLRLPDVPVAWTATVAAPEVAAWSADATPSVVVMDAAVVVDRDTVGAFVAAAPGETLAGSGAVLWRCRRELLPATLQRAGADVATGTVDTHGRASHAIRTPASATTAAAPRTWTAPAGGLLMCARDRRAHAAATRALFARLGRPGDGWFTRVVDRRLSGALTRVLLHGAVTPNQVTLASIAIGIVAGGLFAIGTRVATIAGALLFLASTIIDGCDGELARLTHRESAFGARLDVVGDNVVHVFLFGGIAIGLYRRRHQADVAAAGVLLIVGVVVAMLAVYACVVRRQPTARQRALFEAFASREFAYLLAVLTLAGHLEWFLWLAAAGTYAFVVALIALGGERRPA